MNRIYHSWDCWECFKAGFFTPQKGKQKVEKGRNDFVALMRDLSHFEHVLQKVTSEWKYSCEHNLTNESMNRIAWLGQASCAYAFGCCAEHTRGAFNTLSEAEQAAANAMADKYLNLWVERHEAELKAKFQTAAGL